LADTAVFEGGSVGANQLEPSTNDDLIVEYFNVTPESTDQLIYGATNSNGSGTTADQCKEITYIIGAQITATTDPTTTSPFYAITTETTPNDLLTVTNGSGDTMFIMVVGKAI